jgi:hypothetical protein
MGGIVDNTMEHVMLIYGPDLEELFQAIGEADA